MGTHIICLVVGEKVRSDPMLTAAMICTAHPQSTAASPAISPIVFASIPEFENLHREKWTRKCSQPTTHDRTLLVDGEPSRNVQ